MDSVFQAYNLSSSDYKVDKIGSGHIHQTFLLSGVSGIDFILQRVNKNVFKDPELISSNIRTASGFLKQHFPGYNFIRIVPSSQGKDLFYDEDGYPWRLFPYQKNTFSIDKVDTADRSFKAAAGFGRLTARLNDADVSKFKETIPDFHNLSLRYSQFVTALRNASADRIANARTAIESCRSADYLVNEYESLIASGILRRRVMHNDTKINNILFDNLTSEVSLVIDLDTLMPGYFIYDLGDMIRTFVSPVSEEEKDQLEVIFRENIYNALVDGYLSEMKTFLTPEEKKLIPFSGKMMTYIMGLRFLTDYLNGDVYYQTHYPGQNLVRAGNQMRLLEVLGERI